MKNVPAHEQQSPDVILPAHPNFSKKYSPGLPNIDNIIENVIVFLYFWKYKTRKQKYIISGFAFRVLCFWKFKSTIKYKFHPDKMHPK